jgi:hypothetical protein
MGRVIRPAVMAAVAALALAGAADARRKPALPRCGAAAHTVLKTARVRLFVSKFKYYACWRPTGRVALAYPRKGEGGGVDGDLHAVIVGRYVGFVATSLYDPDGFSAEIVSLDARSGRSTHRRYADLDAYADSAISSFAMDDRGSLAFLETFQGGPGRNGPCQQPAGSTAALIALDHGGRRVLDCQGPGEPADQTIAGLTVAGHVVSWRHLGTTRTATLG